MTKKQEIQLSGPPSFRYPTRVWRMERLVGISRWLSQAELHSVNWLPADVEVLEKLKCNYCR